MSVKYIKSLLFKSAHIQREIEKEQSNRWPDRLRLLRLKKVRLAIKDRLERIIQSGPPHKQLQSIKITMPRRKFSQQH